MAGGRRGEEAGEAASDRLLAGGGGGGGGGRQAGIEVEVGGAVGGGDLAGVVGGRADAARGARVEADRRHGHGHQALIFPLSSLESDIKYPNSGTREAGLG